MIELMNTDVVGNTGTRAVMSILLANELVCVIQESRWLLLVLVVCVIADFRYGWGESHKRYTDAERAGDRLAMAQYRWRTSRAVRRTINKLIDYIIWVAIGVFTGMAVLQPLGIDHMLGGVVATIIAILCEAKSFAGHFLFLHGICIKQKTLTHFLKAFTVALAKKKDEDVAEAIDEALHNEETIQ